MAKSPIVLTSFLIALVYICICLCNGEDDIAPSPGEADSRTLRSVGPTQSSHRPARPAATKSGKRKKEADRHIKVKDGPSKDVATNEVCDSMERGQGGTELDSVPNWICPIWGREESPESVFLGIAIRLAQSVYLIHSGAFPDRPTYVEFNPKPVLDMDLKRGIDDSSRNLFTDSLIRKPLNVTHVNINYTPFHLAKWRGDYPVPDFTRVQFEEDTKAPLENCMLYRFVIRRDPKYRHTRIFTKVNLITVHVQPEYRGVYHFSLGGDASMSYDQEDRGSPILCGGVLRLVVLDPYQALRVGYLMLEKEELEKVQEDRRPPAGILPITFGLT